MQIMCKKLIWTEDKFILLFFSLLKLANNNKYKIADLLVVYPLVCKKNKKIKYIFYSDQP